MLYPFIELYPWAADANIRERIRIEAALNAIINIPNKGNEIIRNNDIWQIVERKRRLNSFTINNQVNSLFGIANIEDQVQLIRAWFDETKDVFLNILQNSRVAL